MIASKTTAVLGAHFKQQRIQTLYIARWVFQLPSLRKLCLIETYQGQIFEFIFVRFLIKHFEERVLWINFKGGLRRRYALTRGLHNPAHLSTHIILTNH